MAPSWITTRNTFINSADAFRWTMFSTRIRWPVLLMGSHSVKALHQTEYDDLQEFDKIAHIYSPIFSICQSMGARPWAVRKFIGPAEGTAPEKSAVRRQGNWDGGASKIRWAGLFNKAFFIWRFPIK